MIFCIAEFLAQGGIFGNQGLWAAGEKMIVTLGYHWNSFLIFMWQCVQYFEGIQYFTVFGVEPDLTREGGSIPVTLTFQEATGKNVMLLPIGACDDGAHSQNEKIDKSNYMNGVGLLLV